MKISNHLKLNYYLSNKEVMFHNLKNYYEEKTNKYIFDFVFKTFILLMVLLSLVKMSMNNFLFLKKKIPSKIIWCGSNSICLVYKSFVGTMDLKIKWQTLSFTTKKLEFLQNRNRWIKNISNWGTKFFRKTSQVFILYL